MIKKSKKGFTLVELVVVIAVLLILAAIAIPTVSGVIDKAQASTDSANARAIETAIKYAIADNEINEGTAGYSFVTTVEGALAKSGTVIDVSGSTYLTKGRGMIFVYTSSTNTVTVVSSGAGTAMTTSTVIDVAP